MEKKEFAFKGVVMNGFVALLLGLAFMGLSLFIIAMGEGAVWSVLFGIVSFLVGSLTLGGIFKQEPNEAKVMVFFGKYRGTFTRDGFFFVNPFLSRKAVSLRARNLNPEPIKVNDKMGNPVMIGMVLVWKLEDTYKALFEIDSQVSGTGNTNVRTYIMNVLENFVRVQSDAALRQVAAGYAYDNADSADELTLRSNAAEINEELEKKLNERLSIAGIHIMEARINYLAYAPEIAAVMLRRQQADAIIAAREKIVDGAVSMVKMALDKLKTEGVVDLDEDKKAAMVSNLLVVLCGDEPAQPVVNSGTLYN